MELQANIWAMHRITAEGLTSLCELEKEILRLGAGASNKQMIELDVKLHRRLFHAAKNIQLALLLDRLLSHYLRFWLSIPREIDPQSFFAETIEIISAIKTKDEVKLGEATAGHIKHSVDEIMGTF
jgi:DNA-binding GntR family transcriptional regulator